MSKWTVIVPVKPTHLAKSRLELPPAGRAGMAYAFACDVLAAVKASPVVGATVIVNGRNEFFDHARHSQVVLLKDKSPVAVHGMNDAIQIGRQWAMLNRKHEPVVVVPADLPCLTAAALEGALERLAHHRFAFTPDASGLGTTLLAASAPELLRPDYEGGSRRNHTRLGASLVEGVDRRVRHDVDTLKDLSEAVRLGVGRFTHAQLRSVIFSGTL